MSGGSAELIVPLLFSWKGAAGLIIVALAVVALAIVGAVLLVKSGRAWLAAMLVAAIVLGLSVEATMAL